jgi:hypothetical protein
LDGDVVGAATMLGQFDEGGDRRDDGLLVDDFQDFAVADMGG